MIAGYGVEENVAGSSLIVGGQGLKAADGRSREGHRG